MRCWTPKLKEDPSEELSVIADFLSGMSKQPAGGIFSLGLSAFLRLIRNEIGFGGRLKLRTNLVKPKLLILLCE
jgi:hypothetical protein